MRTSSEILERLKFILFFLTIMCVLFWEGAMTADETKQMKYSNRLAHESSPYLLQHMENPVDWYPWGEEAFELARKEDKPIFLSIGYATCHWCHVMAHESFEDEEVARILNQHFVSIKVDREERPDIDHIYMSVCQAMTGRGGWPLTIFMTAEAKPFFAGTYFPKSERMGMPGLIAILEQIQTMWQNEREKLLDAGEKVTDHVRHKPGSQKKSPVLGKGTLNAGFEQLRENFDPNYGGFGSSPKFPTPHQLTYLLRWYKRSGDTKALSMVEKTLQAMRYGGIYDQLGFGFHRYSVDEKWLVPHFEKMLYDQALLAMAYSEAYQVTGNALFEQTAKEIFTYVLRDMTDQQGGFYSAEDADSEGEEGLFYIWTPEAIKGHLGTDIGGLFCRFYDIQKGGNFEHGTSIPNIPVSPAKFAASEGISQSELEDILENARQELFNVRDKRVHPLKDDKILTSWNGLMIAAFAKGYQVFGDRTYAEAAKDAAAFVLKSLKSSDGRLLRRYRKGDAAYPGYLDDYAFLVWGLIELYEATFEIRWFEEALALNKDMMEIFWDGTEGGLFFTGRGNEALITRSKEIYDGAIPSGNSVAAQNLMRLGRMTGDVDLEQKAEELTKAFSSQVNTYAVGYTHLLAALDFMIGPGREIVIATDDIRKTQEIIASIRKWFFPNKVVLLKQQGMPGDRLSALSPFVAAMAPVDGQPTVYVCEHYACKSPITDIRELENVFK